VSAKRAQVETAGDCYIVCAGLLEEDEQGFRTLAVGTDQEACRTRAARRVLSFAVEMMQVAKSAMMPHNGQPVQQRVGIHSGPIVSGLIGQLMPKFALL
jgi:class 3 adenylate cyclase